MNNTAQFVESSSPNLECDPHAPARADERSEAPVKSGVRLQPLNNYVGIQIQPAAPNNFIAQQCSRWVQSQG